MRKMKENACNNKNQKKNNLEMNIITKTNIYIVKPITKEEQYICFLFSIKEK